MPSKKPAQQSQSEADKDNSSKQQLPQPAVQDLALQLQPINPVAVLQRVTATSPKAIKPADVLALQRTVGNRAVQRLLNQKVSTPFTQGQRQKDTTPFVQTNDDMSVNQETIEDKPGTLMYTAQMTIQRKIGPNAKVGSIVQDREGQQYKIVKAQRRKGGKWFYRVQLLSGKGKNIFVRDNNRNYEVVSNQAITPSGEEEIKGDLDALLAGLLKPEGNTTPGDDTTPQPASNQDSTLSGPDVVPDPLDALLAGLLKPEGNTTPGDEMTPQPAQNQDSPPSDPDVVPDSLDALLAGLLKPEGNTTPQPAQNQDSPPSDQKELDALRDRLKAEKLGTDITITRGQKYGGTDAILIEDTEIYLDDKNDNPNWPGLSSQVKSVPAQKGQIARILKDYSLEADNSKYKADYYRVAPPLSNKNLIGPSIGLTGKQVGSVKKAAAVEVPRQSLNRDWQYTPTAVPLFPPDPTEAHVKQGNIGDCWLLAALISIVKKNSNFIKEMMTDNGKTVTVRLYDIVGEGANKSFNVRYITVEKSTLKETTEEGSEDVGASPDRGALWVPLLEKAYIAAGFSGISRKQAPIMAVGMLEGGFSDIAFEHLLGRPGERQDITTGGGRMENGNLPWSDSELQNYDKVKESRNYAGLKVYQIFQANITDPVKLNPMVDKWMSSVAPFVNYKLQENERAEYKQEMRIEDFETWFKQYDSTQEAGTGLVLQWIKANNLYPGKRGTNLYTSTQLAMYDKIRQALEKGQMVAVSSKQRISRPGKKAQERPGTNEPVYRGLAGGHAYAVVAVTPPQEESKKIRLRNPWGQTGRGYDFKADKGQRSKDIPEAEFDLELSDLTKRFDTIYIS